MKVLRISLTVEVAVHSDRPTGVSDEELRARLEAQLGDWSDGRYPFSVEQIHDGVRRNVTNAIVDIIEHQVRERYPYNPQRLGQGPFFVRNKLIQKRTNGISVCIHGGGRMTVPSIEEVFE